MRDKKVGVREKFGPLASALITRSKIFASLTVVYYRRRIKPYREDAERMLSTYVLKAKICTATRKPRKKSPKLLNFYHPLRR